MLDERSAGKGPNHGEYKYLLGVNCMSVTCCDHSVCKLRGSSVRAESQCYRQRRDPVNLSTKATRVVLYAGNIQAHGGAYLSMDGSAYPSEIFSKESFSAQVVEEASPIGIVSEDLHQCLGSMNVSSGGGLGNEKKTALLYGVDGN